MAKKPTYEELEQRVKEVEKESVESKRIEKTLRDSEENLWRSHLNLKSLLENTDDYILISDDKGSPILFNSSYARIIKEVLGIQMKPGLKPHKLLPDKDKVDFWDELHRRALTGEKFKTEYSQEFPNGDIRHFEISFTPIIENGEIKGFSELTRDITEKKLAEEALRESEERFELAVKGSGEGIWDWDIATDKTYHSPRFKELLGYQDHEIDSSYDLWESRLHPDDRERVLEEIRQHLEDHTHFDSEYKLRTKSGGYRWFNGRGQAYWDEEGRAIRMAGSIRDITEHKHAQEELKTSQQRLSQIINFLPDATFAIDTEGKVIAWNQAIENMTGIKSQDMLGKGDYEYTIPFYGERRPALIDIVGKWDKEIEVKYQYVKKEGESLVTESYDPLVKPGGFLWGKASLLYDHNGKVMGAIESIRDITDRKVTEEALRESEKRYREFVEGTDDLITKVDKDGKFIFVNHMSNQ